VEKNITRNNFKSDHAICFCQRECVQVVGGRAGPQPQRGEDHLGKGWGAARAQQRAGEARGVERPHLDRAQRAGGDGLQGGHLRGLHDRGAEARPEGVRVDSVQEQGGVGEQHKVKWTELQSDNPRTQTINGLLSTNYCAFLP